MTILAKAHTWIDQPHGMDEEQVELLLHGLLDAQVVAADGAEILRCWAIRGETALELATVVKLLLQRAVQIPLPGPSMDLCGTGGSDLTRYNVSTTVAFVLATAGVPIAKHGNRGSKRPNGSFDLLDALGIPFQLSPPQIAEIFAKTGICFLFARAFHPVVAKVAGMRKLVAGRTIFNLAGPLANPCRPSRQVVGVTNEATAQVIAGALTLLGVERSIVVRGHPGIDEVSITGPTHLWEVADGHTHHRIVEHFHHHGLDHAALPGGDAPENARIFQSLLAGEETGPLHDMVVANAALALDCWRGDAHPGSSSTIDEVRELLASKAVAMSYARHRRVARAVAGLDA
jgi:anthranilate phosphoribosyltransferase